MKATNQKTQGSDCGKGNAHKLKYRPTFVTIAIANECLDAKNGHLSFEQAIENIYNALSGNTEIVKQNNNKSYIVQLDESERFVG